MANPFQTFLSQKTIYKPSQLSEVLSIVRPLFRFDKQLNGIRYFNVPSAFDIESSSFIDVLGNKTAIMYEWSFGLMGLVIIGRTWDEFISMLTELSFTLNLTDKKRLICYIHNASFDFQFFRKYLDWDDVFSVDPRKPLKMVSSLGIEFRCNYLLSGYSLQKIGEDLIKYPVKKLVGYLNYDLIRTPLTPLTEKEIEYCSNDVRVIMSYIQEKIEREGGISHIPTTKTGYVRKYCRDMCMRQGNTKQEKYISRLRYRNEVSFLRLTVDEYKQLKSAFQGGFTHCNPFFVSQEVYNVRSFDFTSSYPAVIIMERFPMGPGELVTITKMSEFYKNLRLYCCLFDIEFEGLESRIFYENYISSSRCWGRHKPGEKENIQLNNGRIVRADFIQTTITGEDFLIIKKFYKWKKMRIRNFRRYQRGYLPTELIKAVLHLYQSKTELKGIEGKEIEYAIAKELLNSCYGMMVTDPCKPLIEYINNLWPDEGARAEEEEPEINYTELINKYNDDKNRFLFYAWGVWVTAYARLRLFTGICEFKWDYIYSDTDSIKVRNWENHREYFEKYNAGVKSALYKAMDYHKLPREMVEPETVDGKRKLLGIWDFDGDYSVFKSEGAKRYMVKYADTPANKPKIRNTYSITVSGVNKKYAIPYICKGLYCDIHTRQENYNPFDKFRDEMYIPPEYTGKMTHTYIDEPMEGDIIDYVGIPYHYRELSGIHLAPADYTMGLSGEFLDYILIARTARKKHSGQPEKELEGIMNEIL